MGISKTVSIKADLFYLIKNIGVIEVFIEQGSKVIEFFAPFASSSGSIHIILL